MTSLGLKKREAGPSQKDDMHECELAWRLTALAEGELSGMKRNQVYVALGAGDVISAVALLVQVIANSQLAVSAELLADLYRWIDAYQRHPIEPAIRRMIGQTATMPDRPTSPTPAGSGSLTTVRPYRRNASPTSNRQQ